MLSTQNPQNITTINTPHQLRELLDGYYSEFSLQQIALSNRQTKPTLRENITAVNSISRFDKLFEIFRQADVAARLEEYLTAEWDELKNTYLSYTSIPEAHITKANCAIAMYLQNTTNKPALTYLMPALKYFKNLVTFEDITELPLPHVLKTHICSDNNESLISIKILTYVELNSDFKKFLVNPCFETKVALSENEINRLKSHSILTDHLISAFTNYNAANECEKDHNGNVIKISLKRALEKLIKGLRAGGEHGGNGGLSSRAEVQAYDALAKFRVYWKLLTDEQKATALAIEPLKKSLETKVNNLQWHTTTGELACVEQLAGELERSLIANTDILATIGLDEDKRKEIIQEYIHQFEISKKDLETVTENYAANELHYNGTDKLFLNVKQIQSMVKPEQIVDAEDVLLIIHELLPEEIHHVYQIFQLQICRAIYHTNEWITVLLFLNEKQVEALVKLITPCLFTQCVEIANILNDAPLIGFLRGMKASTYPTFNIKQILKLTQDFTEAKIKYFMDVYDYESLNFCDVHVADNFNKILPMLVKYTKNREIFESFFEILGHYQKQAYCKSFDINKIFAFTENANDVTYFYYMLTHAGSLSNFDDSADVYLDHVISALPTLVMTIDDMLNILYVLLNHPNKLEKFLDYMLENISHITGDLSNLKLTETLIDKLENIHKEKIFKIIYLSKAIKNREQFEKFCKAFEKEDRTSFINLFTVDEIAELSSYMEDAHYFFDIMPVDKIDAYYAKVEYLYMRNSDQPLFVFDNLEFMSEVKQKTYIEKNIEYLKSFVTNFVCDTDKFNHFMWYIKIVSLYDEKFIKYYDKSFSCRKSNDPSFSEATKAYIKSQIPIENLSIQFAATDLIKFAKYLAWLRGFPMSLKISNEFDDLLMAHFAAKADLDLDEIKRVYQYLAAPKNEVFLDAVRNKMHDALLRCSMEKAIYYLTYSGGLSREVSYYFFNTVMNQICTKPAYLMKLIEDIFGDNFDWSPVIKLFYAATLHKENTKFIAKYCQKNYVSNISIRCRIN